MKRAARNSLQPITLLGLIALGFFLGGQGKTKFDKDQAPSSSLKNQSISRSQLSRNPSDSMSRLRPSWASGWDRPKGPNDNRKRIAELLRWAQEDPLAALSYVLDQANPLELQEQYITAILEQWARREPTLAWEWAWENSRNDCVFLLEEIGKVEPELAWDYAQSHVAAMPNEKRLAYEEVLLGVVYGGNYRQALDFVSKMEIENDLDIGTGRYYFVEEIVKQWFLHDLEVAKEWLKETHANGDVSVMRSAFNELKASWALKEPKDALNFALELPQGEARTNLTQAALGSLIDEDEFTFSMEWLNEHGDGKMYDFNVAQIATDKALISTDAAVAIGWANSIVDENVRNDTLAYLFAEWTTADENSANTYIAEQNPLSEEALSMMQLILKERQEERLSKSGNEH